MSSKRKITKTVIKRPVKRKVVKKKVRVMRPPPKRRLPKLGKNSSFQRRTVAMPTTTGLTTTNNLGTHTYKTGRGGRSIIVSGEDAYSLVRILSKTDGKILHAAALNPMEMGPRLRNFAMNFTRYDVHHCSIRYQNATSFNTQGTMIMAILYDSTIDLGTAGDILSETYTQTIASSAHSVSFPPFTTASCMYKKNDDLGRTASYYVHQNQDSSNLINFGKFYLAVDIAPDVPDGGQTFGRLYIKYSFEFYVDTVQPPSILMGNAMNVQTLTTDSNPAYAGMDTAEINSTSIIKVRAPNIDDPPSQEGPTWDPEAPLASINSNEGSKVAITIQAITTPMPGNYQGHNLRIDFGTLFHDLAVEVLDYVPGGTFVLGLFRCIAKVIGDKPLSQAFINSPAGPSKAVVQICPCPQNQSITTPLTGAIDCVPYLRIRGRHAYLNTKDLPIELFAPYAAKATTVELGSYNPRPTGYDGVRTIKSP